MDCLQENLIQSVLKKHKPPKKIKDPPKMKVKIKRKATEKDDFATPSTSKRSRHSSKSSLTASLCDPQENTELNLSLNNSQFHQNSNDFQTSSSGLRTIIHQWNLKAEDETQKSLCDFFGVITVLPENHPKLFAMLNHIKNDDFFLPRLNLEMWSKWPGSKPNSAEVKNLKEKYPKFSRNWDHADEIRLMKRFKKIMKRAGLNIKNGDSGVLIDEIRSLPEDLHDVAKCLVAGYIGKPFLEEKLAIMVWKRLCVHIFDYEDEIKANTEMEAPPEISADPGISANSAFETEPEFSVEPEISIEPEFQVEAVISEETVIDTSIVEDEVNEAPKSFAWFGLANEIENQDETILPDSIPMAENDPISAEIEDPNENGLDFENETVLNLQRIRETDLLDIPGRVQEIPLNDITNQNENHTPKIPPESQAQKKGAKTRRRKTDSNENTSTDKRSETQQNKVKTEVNVDANGRLPCDLCGKTYKNREQLNKHKRNVAHIPCQQCDKVFRTQSLLSSHIVKIHENPEVKSEVDDSTAYCILYPHASQEYLAKDSDEMMFEFFFGEYIDQPKKEHKVPENLDFYNKIYNFLKNDDFILPKFGLLKWVNRWPTRMPTKEEMVKFRQKYPFMKVGKFTESEELTVIRRFTSLLKHIGHETSLKGKTNFIGELFQNQFNFFREIK